MKNKNAGRTYFYVNCAPTNSLRMGSRSIISVPSWMLDEALAAGMNMFSVYFVTEQDYRCFAKRLATLRKPKEKTLYVVKSKPPKKD